MMRLFTTQTPVSTYSTAVAIAVAIAIGIPSELMAQRVVAPDSVQRTETSADLPDDTIDQTGGEDDDDDKPEPGESDFDSFDDLRIQRVSPDDIPDFQPGLPSGASSHMDADDLPRSLSGEALERVSEHVSTATVEIVAVQTPPTPYRSTDMIYRGHALWISPQDDGKEPLLVATADWLEEADRIYAVDGHVSQALSEGGLKLGALQSESLDDFRGDPGDLLERNRSHLVKLEVDDANRHFNLARLESADGESLTRPTYGMVVHPMDATMPNAIFGFSPAVAERVSPAGYVNSQELEVEYSFYFLVTFQAILGAPIVGPDGRLIGISALRYPEEPDKSLAIPPGAIHEFVGTDHIRNDDDE